MATALYKLVAERGPWSSLSRLALESYLKGDVGKAFMLYSRMAEMGYEVAQSNAAWILDKDAESLDLICIAALCEGYTGSDLFNLYKKAAYFPIRELLEEEKRGRNAPEPRYLTQSDLEEALATSQRTEVAATEYKGLNEQSTRSRRPGRRESA
ncbi:hypothetical protein K1719_032108 [Acacia pycnantha]|nr:hypothetical protein K1719_032108 [Acacia pycnantha]